jgi:hypothetical protein
MLRSQSELGRTNETNVYDNAGINEIWRYCYHGILLDINPSAHAKRDTFLSISHFSHIFIQIYQLSCRE